MAHTGEWKECYQVDSRLCAVKCPRLVVHMFEDSKAEADLPLHLHQSHGVSFQDYGNGDGDEDGEEELLPTVVPFSSIHRHELDAQTLTKAQAKAKLHAQERMGNMMHRDGDDGDDDDDDDDKEVNPPPKRQQAKDLMNDILNSR